MESLLKSASSRGRKGKEAPTHLAGKERKKGEVFPESSLPALGGERVLYKGKKGGATAKLRRFEQRKGERRNKRGSPSDSNKKKETLP